uniref:Uncharacterized protein n=1 Tax=Oreochromis niloticus TaxID=8128 RepID=A0A669DQA8_ORENI
MKIFGQNKYAIILVIYFLLTENLKYGQLCSSNPSNSPRTSDRWGQRHYGARRYSEITFLFLLEGHWMSAGFQGKRKLTEYNDPKKAPTNERINQSGQGGKACVRQHTCSGCTLQHSPGAELHINHLQVFLFVSGLLSTQTFICLFVFFTLNPSHCKPQQVQL